jgi:carboxypeptidase family protein
MGRSPTLSLAAALALLGASALSGVPAPPLPLASTIAPPISGTVRSVQTPVAGALVVLYNVAETSLARLRTATDGTFVVASAPVGVYDLIAYKKGFQPALVRILHQANPQTVSAVEIELARSSPAAGTTSGKSSIWELADRLPADVLRELDLEGAASSATLPGKVAVSQHVGGEVATVAGSGTGESAAVRTSAVLSGGLPNGWRYNLSGEYNAISPDSEPSVTTGNSAGLALAVAPSASQQVELAARRNTISFADDQPARLQTNTVSWSHGNESGTAQSVAARYVEETNLYRASAPGTTFFPIASRTWEVQGNYNRPAAETPGIDVAMVYRYREAAVGPSGVGAQGAFIASSPDADLAASTAVRLSPRAQVQAGVVGRYLAGGYGIAPQLVARYDVGAGTYFFVGGLYRTTESGIGSGTTMPRVASIEDNLAAASRQLYTVGVERTNEDSSFRIEASEQRVGEVVRAFFEGDFLNNLDSVYLLDGNTVRQYQASGRRRLTQVLAATVSARYGQIGGTVSPATAAAYGVTDSRGYYWSARAALEVLSTKTGVAVILHGVRQALETPSATVNNDADKVALSIAQDLSVLGLTPFGSVCKLLLAVESNRTNPSPDDDSLKSSSRFMGGVALSF